jgi:F420H(2)-dependent quinone reductase
MHPIRYCSIPGGALQGQQPRLWAGGPATSSYTDASRCRPATALAEPGEGQRLVLPGDIGEYLGWIQLGSATARRPSRSGPNGCPFAQRALKADPDAVTLQDGAEPFDGHARELSGDERQVWWDRAVSIYPPYADYQRKTDRLIPVFLIEAR